MHQKTGEVHEYINYYLFQNTKDVNLPEIRLKKGENAGNGLNNAFGTKEARMNNSIAKLNDEISQIRTKLNGSWSDTWMVYCNGRDVLKQFLEKYEKRKSFENIRDIASIIGTQEGSYQKT